MRKYNLFFALLVVVSLVLVNSLCYCQTFEYFQQGLKEPTTVNTYTLDAVPDQQGNLFATGFMDPNSINTTIQFQNLNPVEISATTGFVTKYRNSDGVALWQTIFEAWIVYGTAITYVEKRGRLFASGVFIGPLSINGVEQIGVVSETNYATFITELNPQTGHPVKTVLAMIGTSLFVAPFVTVPIPNLRMSSSGGNLFLSSSFTSDVDFGDGIIVEEPPASILSIIAKYDFELDLQLIKVLPPSAGVYDVASNSAGQFCIAGRGFGDVSFDGTEVSGNPQFAYVAKYNKVGGLIYVKTIISSLVGSFGRTSHRVDMDEDGNCYFNGGFVQDVSINGVIIDGRGANLNNIYMGKLDPLGNTIYFVASNNSVPETAAEILGLVAFPSGESYLTGLFIQEIKIGDIEAVDDGIVRDFLLKLDKNGNAVYLVKGTLAPTIGRSLIVDTLGNIVYLGEFGVGETHFGEFSRTTTSINAQFIVRVSEGDENLCARCTGDLGCCIVDGTAQCYNKATHTCTAQNRLCPLNHLSCGQACYLSSRYVCIDGAFLCPVSASAKCGEACYDPTKYTCQNGQLRPI